VYTSITQYMSGTNHLEEIGVPLFESKEFPEEGKGLVARFNIPKGTRILCEKPLLTVRAKLPK
jgi:hypothetical protein